MAIRCDELGGDDFGAYLCSLEDDMERLDLLFQAYHRDVRNLCAKKLALKGNFADADDAAHDALLRAAVKMPSKYNPALPLWPWLSKVATNLCRDYGRGDNRTARGNEKVAKNLGVVTETTWAPESDGPEEEVIRRLRNAEVANTLRAMPEAEREALYYKIFEDVSYEDLGRLTGQSHPSVRSRLYRAMQRWRSMAASRGLEDWGLPGGIGAGASGLLAGLRRFRARSRAWVMRSSVRGSNLAADGAPVNVALVARATEVVAAGVLALGALALPQGDAFAARPTFRAASAAAVSHAGAAPAQATEIVAPMGDSAARPVAAATTEDMVRAGTRSKELQVEATEGGPGSKQGVRREEDSIRIGRETTGEFPIIGELDESGGGVTIQCGGSTVGQAACDAYDANEGHLPSGS